MQQILDLLPSLAQILPFVIAVNLALMGLHSALGMIKDLTASQFDNVAVEYLGKFLGFLQKIIDLLAGNKKH